ncbi:DNA-3-methyladenine glycosylase I [Companilactobacillus sp.]|uniref:DNA-3-methyladenine glycosylase I n=1 Tax=Companilactobacillus sp. TaxID=2767905 RepID=UPI002611EAC6|nr:DNA-3-methyladenine glycosylase I [Companilactobacillus sp.]
MKRCTWAEDSFKEMEDYHDHEWCKPSHDERYFFEMLTLELSQAGLSWSTIIKRRNGYKKAFANFDYDKVAQFDETKRDQLLQNPGIIRNKLKVNATINNAKIIVEMHQNGERFSDYIWSFVDNKAIDHHLQDESQMPAQDELSQTISKDLKKKGFRFVGPTIIYSFLQAVGVINDHLDQCDFK